MYQMLFLLLASVWKIHTVLSYYHVDFLSYGDYGIDEVLAISPTLQLGHIYRTTDEDLRLSRNVW